MGTANDLKGLTMFGRFAPNSLALLAVIVVILQIVYNSPALAKPRPQQFLNTKQWTGSANDRHWSDSDSIGTPHSQRLKRGVSEQEDILKDQNGFKVLTASTEKREGIQTPIEPLQDSSVSNHGSNLKSSDTSGISGNARANINSGSAQSRSGVSVSKPNEVTPSGNSVSSGNNDANGQKREDVSKSKTTDNNNDKPKDNKDTKAQDIQTSPNSVTVQGNTVNGRPINSLNSDPVRDPLGNSGAEVVTSHPLFEDRAQNERGNYLDARSEEGGSKETKETSTEPEVGHFQVDDKSADLEINANSAGVKVKAKPASLQVVSRPGSHPPTPVVPVAPLNPFYHHHHFHPFYDGYRRRRMGPFHRRYYNSPYHAHYRNWIPPPHFHRYWRDYSEDEPNYRRSYEHFRYPYHHRHHHHYSYPDSDLYERSRMEEAYDYPRFRRHFHGPYIRHMYDDDFETRFHIPRVPRPFLRHDIITPVPPPVNVFGNPPPAILNGSPAARFFGPNPLVGPFAPVPMGGMMPAMYGPGPGFMAPGMPGLGMFGPGMAGFQGFGGQFEESEEAPRNVKKASIQGSSKTKNIKKLSETPKKKSKHLKKILKKFVGKVHDPKSSNSNTLPEVKHRSRRSADTEPKAKKSTKSTHHLHPQKKKDQKGARKNAIIMHRPPIIYHPPPEIYHRPDIVVHRAPILLHRPSIIYHQPPVVVHRPAIIYHQPSIVFHQPPPMVHQPIMHSHDTYVTRPVVLHSASMMSHATNYLGIPNHVYAGNFDSGFHGFHGGAFRKHSVPHQLKTARAEVQGKIFKKSKTTAKHHSSSRPKRDIYADYIDHLESMKSTWDTRKVKRDLEYLTTKDASSEALTFKNTAIGKRDEISRVPKKESRNGNKRDLDEDMEDYQKKKKDVVVNRPPIIYHPPPEVYHRPDIVVHRPPLVIHRPPIIYHQPPVIVHRPAVVYHQPPIVFHQPPPAVSQPLLFSHDSFTVHPSFYATHHGSVVRDYGHYIGIPNIVSNYGAPLFHSHMGKRSKISKPSKGDKKSSTPAAAKKTIKSRKNKSNLEKPHKKNSVVIRRPPIIYHPPPEIYHRPDIVVHRAPIMIHRAPIVYHQPPVVVHRPAIVYHQPSLVFHQPPPVVHQPMYHSQDTYVTHSVAVPYESHISHHSAYLGIPKNAYMNYEHNFHWNDNHMRHRFDHGFNGEFEHDYGMGYYKSQVPSNKKAAARDQILKAKNHKKSLKKKSSKAEKPKKKNSVVIKRPPIIYHPPPEIFHRPDIVVHRPPILVHRAPIVYHQPPVIVHRPAIVYHQPNIVFHQPSPMVHQPIMRAHDTFVTHPVAKLYGSTIHHVGSFTTTPHAYYNGEHHSRYLAYGKSKVPVSSAKQEKAESRDKIKSSKEIEDLEMGSASGSGDFLEFEDDGSGGSADLAIEVVKTKPVKSKSSTEDASKKAEIPNSKDKGKVEEKTVKGSKKNSVVIHRPPIIYHPPPEIYHRPDIVVHRPPIVLYRAPIIYHQPPVVVHRPAIVYHQPEIVFHQPPPVVHQPIMHSHDTYVTHSVAVPVGSHLSNVEHYHGVPHEEIYMQGIGHGTFSGKTLLGHDSFTKSILPLRLRHMKKPVKQRGRRAVDDLPPAKATFEDSTQPIGAGERIRRAVGEPLEGGEEVYVVLKRSSTGKGVERSENTLDSFNITKNSSHETDHSHNATGSKKTIIIIRRPPILFHPPSHVIHRPNIMVHRPPIVVHRHPLVIHRAPILVHRMPIIIHRPPVLIHRRPMIIHRPDLVFHRPPVLIHRHPYIVHPHPYLIRRPPIVIHKGPQMMVHHSQYIHHFPTHIIHMGCHGCGCHGMCGKSKIPKPAKKDVTNPNATEENHKILSENFASDLKLNSQGIKDITGNYKFSSQPESDPEGLSSFDFKISDNPLKQTEGYVSTNKYKRSIADENKKDEHGKNKKKKKKDVVVSRPPIIYHPPPEVYHRPEIVVHRAPILIHRPPIVYHQPPVVVHRPAVVYHQPPIIFHQPPPAVNQPLLFSHDQYVLHPSSIAQHINSVVNQGGHYVGIPHGGIQNFPHVVGNFPAPMHSYGHGYPGYPGGYPGGYKRGKVQRPDKKEAKKHKDEDDFSGSSSGDDGSSTVTKKKKHSTAHRKNTVLIYRPPMIYHPPPEIYDRPDIVVHRPDLVVHQPSIVYHQSSIVIHRPPIIYDQPPVMFHQPPPMTHQPIATSHDVYRAHQYFEPVPYGAGSSISHVGSYTGAPHFFPGGWNMHPVATGPIGDDVHHEPVGPGPELPVGPPVGPEFGPVAPPGPYAPGFGPVDAPAYGPAVGRSVVEKSSKKSKKGSKKSHKKSKVRSRRSPFFKYNQPAYSLYESLPRSRGPYKKISKRSTKGKKRHIKKKKTHHKKGARKNTILVHRPPLIYHPPPEIYDRPDVVVHRPDLVFHRPSIVYHQPSVVVHRPPIIYHEPPVVFHQPPPMVHQPIAHSHDTYVPHQYFEPLHGADGNGVSFVQHVGSYIGAPHFFPPMHSHYAAGHAFGKSKISKAKIKKHAKHRPKRSAKAQEKAQKTASKKNNVLIMRPALIYHPPPEIYDRPSVIVHRPDLVIHRPSIVYHMPSVVVHRPPIVYQQPPVVFHQPPPMNSQPIVHEHDYYRPHVYHEPYASSVAHAGTYVGAPHHFEGGWGFGYQPHGPTGPVYAKSKVPKSNTETTKKTKRSTEDKGKKSKSSKEGDKKNIVVAHRPDMVYHPPPEIYDRPDIIVHRPDFVVHQPSIVYHQPSVVVHRPPIIYNQPPIVFHQPPPMVHQPLLHSHDTYVGHPYFEFQPHASFMSHAGSYVGAPHYYHGGFGYGYEGHMHGHAFAKSKVAKSKKSKKAKKVSKRSSVKHHSKKSKNKFTKGHKKNLVVMRRPNVVYHPPPEIYHRPDVILHRPDIVIHRPSVVFHQPAVVVHRPPVVYRQPPLVFHQPPPMVHQPIFHSHETYLAHQYFEPHHSHVVHAGNYVGSPHIFHGGWGWGFGAHHGFGHHGFGHAFGKSKVEGNHSKKRSKKASEKEDDEKNDKEYADDDDEVDDDEDNEETTKTESKHKSKRSLKLHHNKAKKRHNRSRRNLHKHSFYSKLFGRVHKKRSIKKSKKKHFNSKKSSKGDKKNTVLIHRPPLIYHPPPEIYDRPDVVVHRPDLVYHQPSVVYHQSSVVVHRAPIIYHPPPVVFHQPPPLVHQNIVHSHDTYVAHPYFEFVPHASSSSFTHTHAYHYTGAPHFFGGGWGYGYGHSFGPDGPGTFPGGPFYGGPHGPAPDSLHGPAPYPFHGPEAYAVPGPEPYTSHVPEPYTTHGPEPYIGHGPEPYMGHGPEPYMGHGPEPYMGHGPEPYMGHGPEPYMGHGPEPYMGHGPEPYMGHGPEPYIAHGPTPYTVNGPIPGAPPAAVPLQEAPIAKSDVQKKHKHKAKGKKRHHRDRRHVVKDQPAKTSKRKKSKDRHHRGHKKQLVFSRPPIVFHQQAEIYHRPDLVFHRPDVVIHRPPIVMHQAPVVVHKPAIVYHQPDIVVHHAPPLIHQPVFYSHDTYVPRTCYRPYCSHLVHGGYVGAPMGWVHGYGHAKSHVAKPHKKSVTKNVQVKASKKGDIVHAEDETTAKPAKKNDIVVSRPPIIYHPPPEVYHRPDIVVHRAPIVLHRPPIIYHQPPVVVHRPAVVYHQPPIVFHQPPPAVHQPILHSHDTFVVHHNALYEPRGSMVSHQTNYIGVPSHIEQYDGEMDAEDDHHGYHNYYHSYHGGYHGGFHGRGLHGHHHDYDMHYRSKIEHVKEASADSKGSGEGSAEPENDNHSDETKTRTRRQVLGSHSLFLPETPLDVIHPRAPIVERLQKMSTIPRPSKDVSKRDAKQKRRKRQIEESEEEALRSMNAAGAPQEMQPVLPYQRFMYPRLPYYQPQNPFLPFHRPEVRVHVETQRSKIPIDKKTSKKTKRQVLPYVQQQVLGPNLMVPPPPSLPLPPRPLPPQFLGLPPIHPVMMPYLPYMSFAPKKPRVSINVQSARSKIPQPLLKRSVEGERKKRQLLPSYVNPYLLAMRPRPIGPVMMYPRVVNPYWNPLFGRQNPAIPRPVEPRNPQTLLNDYLNYIYELYTGGLFHYKRPKVSVDVHTSKSNIPGSKSQDIVLRSRRQLWNYLPVSPLTTGEYHYPGLLKNMSPLKRANIVNRSKRSTKSIHKVTGKERNAKRDEFAPQADQNIMPMNTDNTAPLQFNGDQNNQAFNGGAEGLNELGPGGLNGAGEPPQTQSFFGGNGGDEQRVVNDNANLQDVAQQQQDQPQFPGDVSNVPMNPSNIARFQGLQADNRMAVPNNDIVQLPGQAGPPSAPLLPPPMQPMFPVPPVMGPPPVLRPFVPMLPQQALPFQAPFQPFFEPQPQVNVNVNTVKSTLPRVKSKAKAKSEKADGRAGKEHNKNNTKRQRISLFQRMPALQVLPQRFLQDGVQIPSFSGNTNIKASRRHSNEDVIITEVRRKHAIPVNSSDKQAAQKRQFFNLPVQPIQTAQPLVSPLLPLSFQNRPKVHVQVQIAKRKSKVSTNKDEQKETTKTKRQIYGMNELPHGLEFSDDKASTSGDKVNTKKFRIRSEEDSEDSKNTVKTVQKRNTEELKKVAKKTTEEKKRQFVSPFGGDVHQEFMGSEDPQHFNEPPHELQQAVLPEEHPFNPNGPQQPIAQHIMAEPSALQYAAQPNPLLQVPNPFKQPQVNVNVQVAKKSSSEKATSEKHKTLSKRQLFGTVPLLTTPLSLTSLNPLAKTGNERSDVPNTSDASKEKRSAEPNVVSQPALHVVTSGSQRRTDGQTSRSDIGRIKRQLYNILSGQQAQAKQKPQVELSRRSLSEQINRKGIKSVPKEKRQLANLISNLLQRRGGPRLLQNILKRRKPPMMFTTNNNNNDQQKPIEIYGNPPTTGNNEIGGQPRPIDIGAGAPSVDITSPPSPNAFGGNPVDPVAQDTQPSVNQLTQQDQVQGQGQGTFTTQDAPNNRKDVLRFLQNPEMPNMIAQEQSREQAQQQFLNAPRAAERRMFPPPPRPFFPQPFPPPPFMQQPRLPPNPAFFQRPPLEANPTFLQRPPLEVSPMLEGRPPGGPPFGVPLPPMMPPQVPPMYPMVPQLPPPGFPFYPFMFPPMQPGNMGPFGQNSDDDDRPSVSVNVETSRSKIQKSKKAKKILDAQQTTSRRLLSEK